MVKSDISNISLDHTLHADPRVGRVLHARYRVLRKLGEGGFGAVYEGEHVGIKRRVALKFLHTELSRNQEVVRRFRREAEAASAIGHENIIDVIDLGVDDDGSVFMALEFLDGRDFGELIDDEAPLSIGRTVRILMQVCDGLGAAHEAGIVHRDLKPENVYITKRSSNPEFAKVLDFGISKFHEPGAETANLTKSGVIMGSPAYMAPEQIASAKHVDGRADIYAIGVMLFQALTGELPFVGETFPQLMIAISSAPTPRISQSRSDVPPELEAVLNRLMEKNPEQRYATCADVKAALKPFADLDDAPASVAPPPRAVAIATTPVQQRRPGWIAPVAAILAVGAIGAGVFAWNQSPAEVPDTLDAPPTEMVAVTIRTDPLGAELRLDGNPVANPFEGELPLQDAPYRIEARLAGHTDASREVVIRHPQTIRIPLEVERADVPTALETATMQSTSSMRVRQTMAATMETTMVESTEPTMTEPTMTTMAESSEMVADASDTEMTTPMHVPGEVGVRQMPL